MNNEAEKYLEPGLLEDYCLGLLPEATAVAITAAIRDSATLQQRVQEIEKALLHYNPAPAGLPLKERILQTLQQLPADTVISLDNPPLITRNSDVIAWNRALENLEPDTEFGSMKVRFIRDTPDWQLCVAWLYESLEETEHPADAFAESFFILEEAANAISADNGSACRPAIIWTFPLIPIIPFVPPRLVAPR